MKGAVIILALALAGSAAAQDSSKRPVGRPGSTANGPVIAVTPVQSIKPDRPAAPQRSVGRGRDGELQNAPGNALTTSERPAVRTPEVELSARQLRRLRKKGAVCGDLDIQGSVVGHVPGRINGCGIKDAVRVRSISGVALSQSSLMDCTTAQALKSWIDTSAKPALDRTGGGLKGLRVAAHYACRTRNNQPGAKISEHGKGRAIDISGFTLRDGSQVSVLKGWTDKRTTQAMRQMHRGACGPFGTVLGPNADSFHRDHFHFDTARYRSGSYCR